MRPRASDAVERSASRDEFFFNGGASPARDIVHDLTSYPVFIPSGTHIQTGEEVGIKLVRFRAFPLALVARSREETLGAHLRPLPSGDAFISSNGSATPLARRDLPRAR